MYLRTMCKPVFFAAVLFAVMSAAGCNNGAADSNSDSTQTTKGAGSVSYLSQPLVTNMYIADPSAHVFNGTLYIYPSHDTDTGTPEKDDGSHFDMRDYHIFSMDSIPGPAVDHGVALNITDIPWAGRQLWAPDAAFKGGTYYLYFPVKDKQDIFRIGVATSTSPTGPFKAQPQPIPGSFSIDPAVFTDENGEAYMYFGGIWGGQLQRWQSGKYDSTAAQEPTDTTAPALTAKVAKLSKDMLHFEGGVKEVVIVDKDGKPLSAGDHNRRFFEGSWMHKYNGKYYFSYSTGDTHFICYAIGDSPYGPFTYQGVILNPVQGWTNHESIVQFKDKWYIFYHDTQLSGKTHLRNVKVAELHYRADGTIEPIDTFSDK